jgi:hypothetical protein
VDPLRVTEVALDRLRFGLSPRNLDDRHVELLQQVLASLPPILVHQETMTVVDGLHRFHAARRSGCKSVAVIWFVGTFEEASLEAVRANISHGRPLTIQERRRAAKRVLSVDPSRSDRAVAEICGLSPKTVASVRAYPAEEIPPPTRVLGRDGRLQRRVRRRGPGVAGRDASGPSATSGGEQVHPPGCRGGRVAEDTSPSASGEYARDSWLPWWECDHALESRCPDLVRWLSRTSPDDASLPTILEAFPTSRLYELVDEARRRSTIWAKIAGELQQLSGPARRATPPTGRSFQ